MIGGWKVGAISRRTSEEAINSLQIYLKIGSQPLVSHKEKEKLNFVHN